MTGTLTPDLS